MIAQASMTLASMHCAAAARSKWSWIHHRNVRDGKLIQPGQVSMSTRWLPIAASLADWIRTYHETECSESAGGQGVVMACPLMLRPAVEVRVGVAYWLP